MMTCACAGIGLVCAKRLYDAEKRWQAWDVLLARLHGELRYTACPLQEAFERIYKQDLTVLEWLKGYAVSDGELYCPRGFSDEEQSFADSFFAFLGTSDLEGQLTHLSQTREKAQELAKAATERRKRLGNVYAVTGICTGVSLALAMI